VDGEEDVEQVEKVITAGSNSMRTASAWPVSPSQIRS
jgi:hypothetical protein